jgi:hypothetical protein
MEGADIDQIAKHGRTSVGRIEKYYAVNIKTSLDAAAINMVRSEKRLAAGMKSELRGMRLPQGDRKILNPVSTHSNRCRSSDFLYHFWIEAS